MTRPAVMSQSSRQRSAVSNGSRLFVGVDGRSAGARRFRELLDGLMRELGGDLGEAEVLQVRNVVSLQLHAEALTARQVMGEAVDSEAITRALNGATRALSALRKAKAARKPSRPPLADVLAARRMAAE